MKMSPVQLLETNFIKVSVEYNPKSIESDDDDAESSLDLEHMTSIKRQDKAVGDDQNERKSTSYFVVVGLRSADKANIPEPYTFEIVISGVIQVLVANRTAQEVDDMAAKFGFTMLYSQIRETLLNITSRMRKGEYMLPTVSFLDVTYPTTQSVPVMEPESPS